MLQLAVLALAYQLLQGRTRRAITTMMAVGFAVLLLSSTAYLQQLSQHTYQVPTTDERFAKAPTAWLNSKAYAAERARLINPNRVMDRVFPGDGIAPLPQVIRDLRSLGFSGTLSLELFNPEYWKQDAFLVAKTGLRKLKDAVRAAG